MTLDENALVKTYEIKVTIIAQQFKRRCPANIDVEDLKQEGRIAVMMAARKFDASRGTAFWTYAEHKVQGAMRDFIAGHAMYRNKRTKEIVFAQPTDVFELDMLADPSTEIDNVCDSFTKMSELRKTISTMTTKQKRILADTFIFNHTTRIIMRKHKISYDKYMKELTIIAQQIKTALED